MSTGARTWKWLALATGSLILASSVTAKDLPQVRLNADNLDPRPIEDLTRQVVSRDYANAWESLAYALAGNRTDLLEGYFTGWARTNLSNRIADQRRTGIRTRYVDHGHTLEAIFYSPAGDAMQLRDQARLEIQTFDGDKLIDSEQVTLHYIVLMTPGADRWLVRDLEVLQAKE